MIKFQRNAKVRENQRGANLIRSAKIKGAPIIGSLFCAKFTGAKKIGAQILSGIRYDFFKVFLEFY